MEGTGPASVQRFTLRTADGEVLDFYIDRLAVTDGGQPAPHLRDHQIDGSPIVVEYEERDGRNVAIRYRDAP